MGLWGGGSTFTERALKWTGENTVYSTWTQEGLLGPRRGERLELAAAIWGISTWGEFLDRMGHGADTCEAWIGDEVLGVGCEEACTRVEGECAGSFGAPCRPTCERLQRHFVDCLANVPDCDFEQCQLPNLGAG